MNDAVGEWADHSTTGDAHRMLHPPRRPRGFMMTPLIDVIFLLLVFFMLSSQLSPFALIPIGTGPGSGPPAQPDLSVELVLTVRAGPDIRLNGVRVAQQELSAALDERRRLGMDTVIVAPASDATLQDVVTVFEAARRAAFPTVAIRRAP